MCIAAAAVVLCRGRGGISIGNRGCFLKYNKIVITKSCCCILCGKYLSIWSLWNSFSLYKFGCIYHQWRVFHLNAIPFYGFKTYDWFTLAYPKLIQTHQIVLIVLIAIIFPFIPILSWSSGVTSYRRSTPNIWWCLSRWWWSQTSLPTKPIIKLSCYTKMLDRLKLN